MADPINPSHRHKVFTRPHCRECGSQLYGSSPPYACDNGHLEWNAPITVVVAVLLVGEKVAIVKYGDAKKVEFVQSEIDTNKELWSLPSSPVLPGHDFATMAATALFTQADISVPNEAFSYLWDHAPDPDGPAARVNLVFMLAQWQTKYRPGCSLTDEAPGRRGRLVTYLPAMAFPIHVSAVVRARQKVGLAP